MLDNDFLQNNNIIDYKICQKFFSKKNDVYLIGAKHNDGSNNNYICKLYKNNNNSIETEAEILKLLKINNVSVPDLIYIGDKSLVLEYIPGPTLLDKIYIDEMERGTKSLECLTCGIISCLSVWLKDFYSTVKNEFGTQFILGDPNLRNFIFSGNKLYGVDFEDVRQGDIEEDIGKLCAFTLMYDPMFTQWKHQFVDILCHEVSREINLDKEYLKKSITKGIQEIHIRRYS